MKRLLVYKPAAQRELNRMDRSDAERIIHALLTLVESAQPIGDEEFARRLAEAPGEEADEETVARILAAEAEQGEMVSHGELKRRLGL